MSADVLFFDRVRHREALARRGADALRGGQFGAAFAFADRLCRISRPAASDRLLRSEAARGLGRSDLAAADLDRAAEIDPTDRTVLRLLLRHGDAAARRGAARALIEDPTCDDALLRFAVAQLFASGDEAALWIRPMAERLRGWAVWRAGATLSLTERRGGVSRSRPLASDPRHVLAEADRRASALALEFDDIEEVSLTDGERRLAAWTPPPRPPAPPWEQKSAKLWIVVPVYEDFPATRACLRAVMAQLDEAEARLVAVDDASPNAALRGWLDVQAAGGRLDLIRNPVNLGFALSVNRALAVCGEGDVVLLNADALPPPGAFRRLAELARAAPDVGALTPLSNNGETCSFPTPNASSPLPSEEEIARLDALARRANGDSLIDLPNGIGFCLYITRACLDAVGPLPHIYGRGYFEDVEFCLRAREKGFRTVCAAGVYVGHAGSLSFGADKRGLVMRNLRLLKSRFPEHEAECAAFLRADPLRGARAALERLAPPQGVFRLLVAAEGACALEAEAQARAWAGEGPAPLLCRYDPARQKVVLRGPKGEAPQSLVFSLRDGEGDALRDWLGGLRLSGVALFFSAALPPDLVERIASLDAELELAVAQLDFFAAGAPAGASCEQIDGARPCRACASALSSAEDAGERLRVWQAVVRDSACVRPLDRMTAHVARKLFPEGRFAAAPDLDPLPVSDAVPVRSEGADGARVLGVLAPLPEPGADSLIVALARVLRLRGDPARIVVLGACVDDLAVMAPGNVFVTGAVEPDELAGLIGPYGITEIMACSRTRFFGRLDALAARAGLARAAFDWSSGILPFDADDLALDPRLCDRKAAVLIADWLAARRPGSRKVARVTTR